jgi:uncharacterized delta-60 repeat protein
MKRFLIAAFIGLGLVACGGGTTPPATPGFTISLAPATATVIPGKSINTIVNAVRAGGFNDAINVTLAAQTGINAASLTIPAGGSSGALTLETTALLPQTSSPLAVTLTGKGAALPDQTTVLSLTVRGASGAADTTLGNNGLISTSFDSSSRAARFQADGKLISVSVTIDKTMQVNRFNANGSPDTGFGTAGSTVIDFGLTYGSTAKIAFQPDGKIVVGAAVGAAATRDIGLARLNANGTIDNSFDMDGIQILDFGGLDTSPAQMVASNTKILVAGSNSTNDFALARFNSNGALDTSFDTDGKLILDLGGIDTARAAAVQSDGKIVVAGRSVTGISPNLEVYFAIARVNDNGTLDNTFDADGKTTVYMTYQDGVFFGSADLTDLVITSDGKIVMAGDSTDSIIRTQKFAVVRLLSTGQPDSSFAGSGKVLVGGPSGDYDARVLFLPDGRIMLVGSSYGVYAAGYQVYLVRVNTNGSLDTTFGDGGRSYIPASFNGIFDAALLADGKIQVLASGFDNVTSKYNLNITRYWP